MKRLVMKPADFPCTVEDCPPGFFLYDEMTGFKSEYYSSNHKVEAYCDTGEAFCYTDEDLVTPLNYVWEEI